MKRAGRLAVLLATVALFLGAGCASKESKIVGRWFWTHNGQVSQYFADGTMAAEQNGRIWARTWWFTDDKLIIASETKRWMRYVEFPNDDTMVVTAIPNGRQTTAHRLPDR
jgi:hypothetical protein